MCTVLITGATGNVGSRVAADLVAAGVRPRLFVRDATRLMHRWQGGSVEVALGDFDDEESVEAAMRGIDRIFLTSADGPDKVAHECAVIAAAKRAGVGRIVKLSAMHARTGSPLPAFDWHGRIEAVLADSGMPHVLLRPAFFLDNLLMVAPGVAATGHLAAPTGGARAAMVDVRDVAASAASAVLANQVLRDSYDLTGPESVTFAQVADAIATATKQTIVFDDLTPEEAAPRFAGAGLPSWLGTQLSGAFGVMRDGGFDAVSDGVRELTGRRARAVSSWARVHAAAFVSEPAPAPPQPSVRLG
ncbi:NAD(P)H-binding protein [Gordonia sp. ABSL11-1]|uniref:NAD(P)H-binding protein n=1 Tax=Gordonia sp. ABSL11-1 TaxID=3053924 RepID=UPI0025730D6D|nr:NAD(P)H-binding protein [Gordonia sp. ABSL11-1]MDL9948266.1 NAD(P)H-binding protein [Gordonia sp. ABSL11-1]